MAYGRQPAGDVRQYTTLKVRLYPDEAQAELFEKTFGCCRWIWNRMLADQQRFYLETDAFFIPTPAKYKREAPFLKEVDNQALTQEYNQLNRAFRAFFRDPEHFGYPKIKRRKSDRNSFTACNHVLSSGPTVYTTHDGIRMTKAGIVKARFSRRPQAWWNLRRITVSRSRSGKYFCSILYEYQTPAPQPVIPAAETTLGLKYSPAHFYVTDGGDFADPPHWLRDSREKLAKLQRRISRMEPGSKNYQAAVQKYRLLHEHIANQRRDFIHKESRRTANAWDAVCMRADDLAELSRRMRLAKPQEAGFGMFRECLRRKLEQQGKALILVDRYVPTSRTCSHCGAVREAVPWRERSWTCPECGAVLSREINAARNIKALGLEQYLRLQERRESA